MAFYDVKLRVSGDQLITILKMLSGPNKLVGLERSPITAEVPGKQGRKSTLLHILMDGRPHNRPELIDALEKNGFSSSGLDAILRSIAKQGRLCRFRDGSLLYNSGSVISHTDHEEQNRSSTARLL